MRLKKTRVFPGRLCRNWFVRTKRIVMNSSFLFLFFQRAWRKNNNRVDDSCRIARLVVRRALLCIDGEDLTAITCASTAGLRGPESDRRGPGVRKGHMGGGERKGLGGVSKPRGLIPAAYLLITAITQATLACLFACLFTGMVHYCVCIPLTGGETCQADP